MKEKEEFTPLMNFGEAIQALKEGKAIQRLGWNGKNMFVVKQIPAHITSETIPNMQSLPQSAKNILMSRVIPEINYTNQMLIINESGRADSWIPSSSDVFAEDWIIYEKDKENTWLERLWVEESELLIKLLKLTDFYQSEKYLELDEENQELLEQQLEIMALYDDIFRRRINLNCNISGITFSEYDQSTGN